MISQSGGSIELLVFSVKLVSSGEMEFAYAIEQEVKNVSPDTKFDMVVAVVPNDNKARYDAIKDTCCLKTPVPSQVIRRQTLQNTKIFESVCLKVLLQMNCKLGGSTWKIKIPLKTSLIIGYDLYHDSTERGKTVGAAVSSMDREFTRWYSQCELHQDFTQLGQHLGKFVKNAVLKWHEINRELPTKIFLYRDGVSEGQLDNVNEKEIPLVISGAKDAAIQLGKGEHLFKIAFIVVTKRVNTRYFKKDGDNLINPIPGTVVDRDITKPNRVDWYLVPQHVQQGTVTPVHFHLLKDDTGLKLEQQEKLAFKLCHLYYNWQGTIRVPAPCQYAYKLAFLVSQSLHKSAGIELSDKLYFL